MKKYEVYVRTSFSQLVGTFEAESAMDAEFLGIDTWRNEPLCSQCSNQYAYMDGIEFEADEVQS